MIDLTSLSQLGSAYSAANESSAAPFSDIGYGDDASAPRFYLSGIMGTAFARATAGGGNNLLGIIGLGRISVGQTGSSDQSLFTGGVAMGMAIDRPGGQLRMEVEGRYRDPMYGMSTGYVALDGTPIVGLPLGFRVGTGWSAMTNFWRDFAGHRRRLPGHGQPLTDSTTKNVNDNVLPVVPRGTTDRDNAARPNGTLGRSRDPRALSPVSETLSSWGDTEFPRDEPLGRH